MVDSPFKLENILEADIQISKNLYMQQFLKIRACHLISLRKVFSPFTNIGLFQCRVQCVFIQILAIGRRTGLLSPRLGKQTSINGVEANFINKFYNNLLLFFCITGN